MIQNKLKSPTCNKPGTCPRLQGYLRLYTPQTQSAAFIEKKKMYLHYLKQVANIVYVLEM